MKGLKKFLVGLLYLTAGISPFTFAGCEEDTPAACEHEFLWYTVTEATCTEKGEIEGVCEKCGGKRYQDVEEKEHDYENGVCTVCEKSETESVPLGEDIGWTMDEIDDYAERLGFSSPTVLLTGYRMQDPYVDKLGRLCFTAQEKTQVDADICEVVLPDMRDEFSVAANETPFSIIQVEVFNSSLYVTTRDGVEKNYGYLKFCGDSPYAEDIVKIAINKQNQVIVLYENGTWRAVGKLSTDDSETYQGEFVYHEADNGYILTQSLVGNVTSLTIPRSHRGTPVVAIGWGAFNKCADLEVLVLPKSVTTVSFLTFADCEKLQTVYYGGTESEWNAMFIQSGNTPLREATRYYYSEEAPTDGGNYWHYDTDGKTILVWGV